MKINTVNVIECYYDTIRQILSFTDDKEGNKEAEDIFLKLIQESGYFLSDEDKTYFLDDGIFYDDNGWSVTICHSINNLTKD